MTDKRYKYYDWTKTLSYDAPITMVISQRGIGKTYGLRKQCILDYIKRGTRFVQLARYKTELKVIEPDYFERVKREFKSYDFKIYGHKGWIKPHDTPKNAWQTLCYFVALTDFQVNKQNTFADVKRIILDEAIRDPEDKYHRYLPNEWDIVTNLVDSIAREHADTIKPRLYLLGNACDILNPYFQAAGLTGTPPQGYSWHMAKMLLLHYYTSEDYKHDKACTLAGRMALGTGQANALDNEFTPIGAELLGAKSSNAKYLFALALYGGVLAVWVDDRAGMYYVNNYVPRNEPIYSLTLDGAPNYKVLNKINPYTNLLLEAHKMGLARYETLSDYQLAKSMFEFMGYRW